MVYPQNGVPAKPPTSSSICSGSRPPKSGSLNVTSHSVSDHSGAERCLTPSRQLPNTNVSVNSEVTSEARDLGNGNSAVDTDSKEAKDGQNGNMANGKPSVNEPGVEEAATTAAVTAAEAKAAGPTPEPISVPESQASQVSAAGTPANSAVPHYFPQVYQQGCYMMYPTQRILYPEMAGQSFPMGGNQNVFNIQNFVNSGPGSENMAANLQIEEKGLAKTQN